MSMQIGPVIPPEFLKQNEAEENDSDEFGDNEDERKSDDVSQTEIGPTLPKIVLNSSRKRHENEEISHSPDIYGPALPPELNESEEPEVGPSFVDETEDDYALRILKFRAENSAGNNAGEKREEWMTQLPTKLRSYGLGARTFSRRGVESGDEDRSIWTDDPADKRRKIAVGEKTEELSDKRVKSIFAKEKDKEYEEQANALNKSRTESLLDMHASSAKEANSLEKQERRPFDRDKDLKSINLKQMDKASLKKRAV